MIAPQKATPQNAMEVFIQSDAVRIWSRDAFAWPAMTIAAATLIYTTLEWMADSGGFHFDLTKFRVSGELVGGGGMLFSVLILKSAESRLAEWEREVQPYTLESDHVKRELEDNRDGMGMLVAAAMVMTWIFVMFQVQVVHHERGVAALIATALLIVGNALIAAAAYAFCLRKMYKARACIIGVYRQYRLRTAQAEATEIGVVFLSKSPVVTSPALPGPHAPNGHVPAAQAVQQHPPRPAVGLPAPAPPSSGTVPPAHPNDSSKHPK
jgi:hypothetical protein